MWESVKYLFMPGEREEGQPEQGAAAPETTTQETQVTTPEPEGPSPEEREQAEQRDEAGAEEARVEAEQEADDPTNTAGPADQPDVLRQLLDLVPDSDQVNIVEGDRYGYDPATGDVIVPKKYRKSQLAPVRILREMLRATASDENETDPRIIKEVAAREHVADLLAEQDRVYREVDGRELQEQYEVVEKEASDRRQAAEKALDEAVAEVVEQLKEEHGVDAMEGVGEEGLKKLIREDLQKDQDELVYRTNDDEKGYYTGKKPGILKGWLGDSEPMQDLRYRKKLMRSPFSMNGLKYGVAAGVMVGYPAWLLAKYVARAPKYLFGKAWGFTKNRLYNMEQRGFKELRAGSWKVASGVAGVFGAAGDGLLSIVGLGKYAKLEKTMSEGLNKRATAVDKEKLETWTDIEAKQKAEEDKAKKAAEKAKSQEKKNFKKAA